MPPRRLNLADDDMGGAAAAVVTVAKPCGAALCRREEYVRVPLNTPRDDLPNEAYCENGAK